MPHACCLLFTLFSFKEGIRLIISASRRTDIPAFFGDWFMEQINSGSFTVVNPFNPSQRRLVSVTPETVEAIVFWSKDPGPFLDHLDLLDDAGYRYYFLYTFNDYPRFIEPKVPDLNRRLATFQSLAERLGPARVIWRYDPIIFSNLTPLEYHLEHFADLTARLRGYTGRVIISLLDDYPRIRKRIIRLREEAGWEVTQAAALNLEGFTAALSRTATTNGMTIQSCAEPLIQAEGGIQPGACIDPVLLNRLFGLNLTQAKDKYQRPDCGCAAAVDIGTYNTCGMHCVYCYANAGSSR